MKTMNARKRLLAALRAEAPDRVPLILAGLYQASPEQVEDPGKREIWIAWVSTCISGSHIPRM